ncbi:diguanylate cyclase [Deinococcus metalli]|uniref:Diguanylate cyclase n=1 Tax=Deinococcus metalli TaxID=1141878 RepID=A0A7W8KH24_9DEIO|nr:diguanylate cyclase [Deinococcus metalli]MBB5378069.1 diguanylate cyclase [Deinococcus metalli]GHF54188.1 GGDEF domain-containing protein [Deinococcus metalli]
MLTTLFLNLCILTSCAFMLGFTYRRWPVQGRGPWFWARSAGLAATGLLLMQFPATVVPGVFADLRAVPVVFTVLHSGPVAGLAVALPLMLYRLHLGGIGAPIMVLSTISMLLVGTVVRRLDSMPGFEVSWRRRVTRSLLTLLPNGVGLLLLPNGQTLFAQTYLPLLLLSLAGYVVVMMIVDSRLTTLRLLSTLEGQALLDPLTDVANRRQFEHDLPGLTVGDAVVMVDIDHFKALNDTYGHPMGDAALREVAQRLRGELRGGDRAYRYGGEEFAVILRDVGATSLPVVAERLRAAVGRDPLSSVDVPVTVSVGAALMVTGDPRQVVGRADQALYQAKAAGRNCTVMSVGADFQQSGQPGSRSEHSPASSAAQA